MMSALPFTISYQYGTGKSLKFSEFKSFSNCANISFTLDSNTSLFFETSSKGGRPDLFDL